MKKKIIIIIIIIITEETLNEHAALSWTIAVDIQMARATTTPIATSKGMHSSSECLACG